MDGIRDSVSGQAGLQCELLTAAMEPQLRAAGISLGTFELLSAVHAGGGSATQAEVARRLGITAPSLTESVKSAVARNLIEQHIDSGDGRRKILQLTATGQSAMQEIVRGVNNAESRMVDGIDSSQIALVVDVLKRVNRNLARIVQDESQARIDPEKHNPNSAVDQ